MRRVRRFVLFAEFDVNFFRVMEAFDLSRLDGKCILSDTAFVRNPIPFE